MHFASFGSQLLAIPERAAQIFFIGENMPTVLITGGTGLIGSVLSRELLRKGYEVIVMTRDPGRHSSTGNLRYAGWDPEMQIIDATAISSCEYIVNLAGADLAEKRWTVKRKNEIIDSRTKSAGMIVTALRENTNRVKAVISASAIGWYGEATGDKVFVETDPPADDFLGTVCKAWEESFDPVVSMGKRLVKLRTGIVLSNAGGALPKFKNPLRFGLATILGSGRQVISWIHIDDLAALYLLAIENERLNGAYNVVSPQPVPNKKFVLQLAKVVRGRYFIPVFVPSFLLKMILGEMSIEVLKHAPVSSEKIKREGYKFLYPSLKAALEQLR